HTGHEEIVVADRCGASLGCAAVDRTIFADQVPVANFNSAARFVGVTDVLRSAANYGAVPNTVARAYDNLPFKYGVSADDSAVSNRDFVTNDAIRTNLDGRPDLCPGTD